MHGFALWSSLRIGRACVPFGGPWGTEVIGLCRTPGARSCSRLCRCSFRLVWFCRGWPNGPRVTFHGLLVYCAYTPCASMLTDGALVVEV